MGKAGSTYRGIWLLAFALALTLGLSLHMGPGRMAAYAAESASSSQLAAQLQAGFASERTLGTLDVSKRYPSTGKMSITMAGGDVTTISTNGIGSKAIWSSSNSKVAKVKATGTYKAKVTALNPGKATIKVKNNKGTMTCAVTVTGKLSKTKVTLNPFSTSKLTFKGMKGHKVKKWASSNGNVKVNSKGVLTPIADGKSTITCTDNKGYKYRCAITVSRPSITCKIGSASNLNAGMHWKPFSLTNKCGKSIVLNTRALYYSTASAISLGRYQILYTSRSAQTYTPLTANPYTVKNKKSVQFVGGNGVNIPISTVGVLCLGFKVGNIQYMGWFNPVSGKMISCSRL